MRVFFDNNIAPRLARGFNEFVASNHSVIHLREKFPANTSDVEWTQTLAAEKDWVIISGDVAISRNPHEVEAWKTAGHTMFFLKPGWTHLPFWQQVEKLAKCFPEILERALQAHPGDGFLVGVNGKVE